ncbi:hypothetical protein [Allosalinactinospora lopnorensis]|uniref:hypothetical protein n=1 Tax=Allosalinactinospora lopnorensis TaxID=1352348 RepID=UPI0006963373|nr:hypothetical protein [Allosalinactinospora lopnorensis]
MAQRICFLGSIKWLERRPFDAHDLGALAAHRDRMPGADGSTPLLAVSRGGTAVGGVATFGPEELLAAWR